jgi:hypothetical protein
MNFRVKVTIEVIDEEGNVVDHRGHAHRPTQATHNKLQTSIRMSEHDGVTEALNKLNGLHQILAAVKELAP